MDALQRKGQLERMIAGFWCRVGAMVADLILLTIVGLILGGLFFHTFARKRAYACLICYANALTYFGIGEFR